MKKTGSSGTKQALISRSGNEGKWSNKDSEEGVEVRVQDSDADETNFKAVMNPALQYVLKEWEENQWNSQWFSDQGSASGTQERETVMMTGSLETMKSSLLKFFDKSDLKDQFIFAKYQGELQDTRGTMILGLSGCTSKSMNQCQIDKKPD